MKKIAFLLLFVRFLCADNPILRPNEALVIDAKSNEINFVLELTKDGKIKKRFLSNGEKNALYKALNINRAAKSSGGAKLDSADSARGLDSADSAKNANFNGVDSAKNAGFNGADSAKNANFNGADSTRHSHIKQWDKKKIIYEQRVYKMENLR